MNLPGARAIVQLRYGVLVRWDRSIGFLQQDGTVILPFHFSALGGNASRCLLTKTDAWGQAVESWEFRSWRKAFAWAIQGYQASEEHVVPFHPTRQAPSAKRQRKDALSRTPARQNAYASEPGEKEEVA